MAEWVGFFTRLCVIRTDDLMYPPGGSVLSQQVGRDSNPDSLCSSVSGMETRPAKLSLPGLMEKSMLLRS